MPINHIFLEANWNNGFETHNAILDTTPYKPEVMIVGTFNPSVPGNSADFFYGRNFFWRAFKNMFIYNQVLLQNRRIPAAANVVQYDNLDPLLAEIFCLCIKLKLTFSDLITKVLDYGNPDFELLEGTKKVSYQGQIIDLIKDGIGGLGNLQGFGQINWNTKNIIDYLCNNPQISQVYLTRQPNGIWQEPWNDIKNHPCMYGRIITNIYTPSGIRLRAPKMNSLIQHWVHNENLNFGVLNRNWLEFYAVNPENF